MDRSHFFKTLYQYCEGKIEIRILPGRRQIYFNKKDVDGMLSTFRKYKKSQVYFGVATRDGFGGTKGNIVEIPAIWCDVDYKDIARKQLAELYRGFPFKPTIIIKSGGGVHFYWCLSEPVGQNEISLDEDVNKRIAFALGGDFKACNAATVLRPPGTYNNKPEYDPPHSGNDRDKSIRIRAWSVH